MNVWNISLLKYFYDAATHHSVAASARLNHVSQSAVSQAIHKIEDQLGVSLLNHKKRQFLLTDEGHAVLSQIEVIFKEMDQLNACLKKSNQSIRGELRLASSQSLVSHVLPKSLRQLQLKAPQITPHIKLGRSLLIKEWVLDGRSEIGCLIDKGSSKGLEEVLVREGSFVIVAPSKYTGEEFSSEDFLFTEERNEVSEFKEKFMERFGTLPRGTLVIESWGVICCLVSQGMGLGLVPDFAAQDSKRVKILKMPFKMPRYQIKIIYKNERNLSRASRLWMEMLLNQFE